VSQGRWKRKGDWEVDLAAMSGSLVHEIKNPLSTLNLNAQLILEDWKDAVSPREQRTVKRLKVILSEVERLERIVDSFLRFTERHELDLKPCSLNQLLEELADFIGPEARKKNIQVRLGLDHDLEPFPLDGDLMRQVFLNLVVNAKNAMEEKGGELILRTRKVERNGTVWAVGDVIDTGNGIPPQLRQRIFDLYFSTRREGTGLGLSTSKRITEEHGGFIEVQSDEGKGSHFSVFLPMSMEEGKNESDVSPEEAPGAGI
jgi:two-component system sensor histidine kinase HydH